MKALALVGWLRGQGVELSASEGKLRWRAPAGALTAEIRQVLREYREDLLAVLSTNRSSKPSKPPAAEIESALAWLRNPSREAIASFPGDTQAALLELRSVLVAAWRDPDLDPHNPPLLAVLWRQALEQQAPAGAEAVRAMLVDFVEPMLARWREGDGTDNQEGGGCNEHATDRVAAEGAGEHGGFAGQDGGQRVGPVAAVRGDASGVGGG